MTDFLITPSHHQFLHYSTTLGISPSPQMFIIQSSLQWLHVYLFPTWMTAIISQNWIITSSKETSSMVVLPPKFSSGQLYICSNIICCSSTIAITTLYCILSLSSYSFPYPIILKLLELRAIYCLWKPILDGPQFLS